VEERLDTALPPNLDKTKSATETNVYSSPKIVPSSHTNASLSTSGSTTIPKSAFSLTTRLDISFKFSGRGSGLWGKSPFGVQYNSTHSTPNFFNNLGIIVPPVELTASNTTLYFF
jgi:hypothetical protein